MMNDVWKFFLKSPKCPILRVFAGASGVLQRQACTVQDLASLQSEIGRRICKSTINSSSGFSIDTLLFFLYRCCNYVRLSSGDSYSQLINLLTIYLSYTN